MGNRIYTLSTCQYRQLKFLRTRGIKEGSPFLLVLFVLVYETYQPTLADRFPQTQLFVYVDDIAIISDTAAHLQRALHIVQELSLTLGFQTNPMKMEIYQWPMIHVALCVTLLLAGCLCWFNCAFAGVPHYFSVLMNGNSRFCRTCVIQNARNTTANSKMPCKPEKNSPPPPCGSGPPWPRCGSWVLELN